MVAFLCPHLIYLLPPFLLVLSASLSSVVAQHWGCFRQLLAVTSDGELWPIVLAMVPMAQEKPLEVAEAVDANFLVLN